MRLIQPQLNLGPFGRWDYLTAILASAQPSSHPVLCPHAFTRFQWSDIWEITPGCQGPLQDNCRLTA